MSGAPTAPGHRRRGRAGSFVILMYHRIVEESDLGGVDRDRYDVSLGSLEKQIAYLDDAGFRVLGLDDFERHRESKTPLGDKGVIITFDDGRSSDVEHALPVLTRRGFRAEFFLTTSLIGRPGYLAWRDARRLVEAGMGIGSHARRHVYLSDLSPESAATELAESKESLEDHLDTEVAFLAPPGGRINGSVTALARSTGYRGICTSRLGVNDVRSDPYDLCRIPVVGATTMSTFRSIVHQDRTVLRRYRTSAWCRDVLKATLGNRMYDRLRGAALARKNARV